MIILYLILAVSFIVIATTRLNIHPFLALILAAFGFGLCSGMPLAEITSSINTGFGDTIGKIGIIIIAGTIIGVFLEKSGGAFALAEKILKIIGEKSVITAMSIIGYIVAIPVFSDSGLVILTPLNKALSKRAKISLAGAAVGLGLGLSATHSLVPPTPGPIAAAGLLDADLGLVIAMALPVSFIALVFGWLFAVKYAAKQYVDPNPEMSETEISQVLKNAPSAFQSFTPILVPLILIILRSVAELPSKPFGDNTISSILSAVGDPVVALLIGVGLSFLLPKKFDTKMMATTGWVGKGVMDAALIIIITGAGGAFGRVLQNSGIADVISGALSSANMGIWLPFILAAAIKSAQGSSTVSIITTASIMVPLLGPLGFDSEMAKAVVVLTIGAGALVVSHANDSFFWVFTQMNGFTVKQGIRFQTLGTLILGLSAAICLWIISLFI